MVTLHIVKSLRSGDLAVNSNSPILSPVKLWRVSRNLIYTECFYKFTACFTEWLLFFLYLFISPV